MTPQGRHAYNLARPKNPENSLYCFPTQTCKQQTRALYQRQRRAAKTRWTVVELALGWGGVLSTTMTRNERHGDSGKPFCWAHGFRAWHWPTEKAMQGERDVQCNGRLDEHDCHALITTVRVQTSVKKDGVNLSSHFCQKVLPKRFRATENWSSKWSTKCFLTEPCQLSATLMQKEACSTSEVTMFVFLPFEAIRATKKHLWRVVSYVCQTPWAKFCVFPHQITGTVRPVPTI